MGAWSSCQLTHGRSRGRRYRLDSNGQHTDSLKVNSTHLLRRVAGLLELIGDSKKSDSGSKSPAARESQARLFGFDDAG